MASAHDMRQRIRSVNNIAQLTRALEAVSISRVRKAENQVRGTRPYGDKAWEVLRHLARQRDREDVHPLLTERSTVKSALIVMISGNRGLAGAYNTNIVQHTLKYADTLNVPIRYITVGRRGRDILLRQGARVVADFSDLSAEPAFNDVSAIGSFVIDEFLQGNADEVYLMYTRFESLLQQVPVHKKLLPLEYQDEADLVEEAASEEKRMAGEFIYTYEPGQTEIISRIIIRLTELQVFTSVLESLASEHAARMVAMSNANSNSMELLDALTLELNRARQQSITNDILDIVGGAQALE